MNDMCLQDLIESDPVDAYWLHWMHAFVSQCLLVWSHEVSLESGLAYQHERAWVGLLERASSSMVEYC